MDLPKYGREIIAVIVALFFLAMVAMVASNMVREDNPVKGSLAHTLEDVEGIGLAGTAVAPFDVYGEDWIAAAIVCPGQTYEQVAQAYEVDPSVFHNATGEIPESTNYMMVRQPDGTAHVEKLNRYEIDLCTVPVQGYFEPHMMLPLVKDQQGVWTLAQA